jgi:hypothetical protein
VVVFHDAFDRFLPGAHLLRISHLDPLGRAELFQETAVFSNQPKVGNSLEKTVELFRLTARHYVDSITVIEQDIIQNIKSAL